ncbi:Imm50 family immunity protein [Streptomyces massasporeus]|uniref:Imm50 family immunity protein n=1 Tax=Streptomyces massasporeus TaxID=67324 RepID=UPI0033FB72D7
MTDDLLVANAELLRDLYSDGLPSLHNIRLRSVNLNWRGPAVTLRMDLPDFPDEPPEAWRQAGLDTVQCQLQFLAVEHIRLQGWNPPVTARIDVTRISRERRVRVQVTGTGMRLEFTSSSTVLIGHFSAFARRADGSDGGRHQFLRRIDGIRHSGIPDMNEKVFYERI